MTNDAKNGAYNAPVLYKAFAVLEEIARHQSRLGVSDLARRLGFSKSTVYGIVQALIDIGALRQDGESKKLALGPTLVRLGSQALAEIDIRSIALPYMEKLGREFKETVFMGTFDEHGITIIEKADSPQELKITAPVGTRIPVFAGAAGKVFLAALKDEALHKMLNARTLPRYTENSFTDPDSYRRELEKVRREGYATDFGEYIRDVNAISVPISDPWGWPVAALWMVGFSHSFTGEKMERAALAARRAAAEIREILKERFSRS